MKYENKADTISESDKQTNHLVENNKYVLFTNIFILLLELVIPFIKYIYLYISNRYQFYISFNSNISNTYKSI